LHIHQISTTGFAIMAIFASHFVHAEGSYQTGLNQPLEETSNSAAPLYVDVINAGEVINVSLCGEANDNNVRVRIFDPANSSVLDTTLLSGNVTCDDPFTSELTNPVRYTTNTIGSYRIELDDTDGGNILNRFDISITPNVSTNPDPTLANGRLWGYQWSFNAGTFTELGATDADYYALVPGGRPATHYVWKLDLNKFAGFAYDIVANDQGVDAPSSGYSVETNVNNVTPKFPIYLSYPVVANQRPTDPPLISDFRFIDSDGQDYAISPAATHGIQDSGNFEFTTDVAGTYAITIDTNSDGSYGANDILLLGTAVVGLNQVNWNGRDARVSLVANGTYHARLQLRLGEYHFIAHDAETSGGPSSDGLTIFLANSDGSTNDTLVYWDDATYLGGGTTLPNGALASTSAGRHTWGNFTGSGFGDKRYIDTYVYGLTSSQTTLTAIIGSDALLTGTDGSINAPATGPTGSNIPITVTDADLNLLPGISESIIVQAVNNRSAEIEHVVLTETGLNTGIFSGSLSTTNNANTGTNNNGILNIVNDDAIDIDYQDQLDSNGLTTTRTTRYLASRDSDNDGIVDTLDLDSDNDGIPDSVEGDASIDSDADGTPDYLDRDSDGDGIDDIIEAGGSDTNNDGQVDGFTDTNNDGLDDTLAATPLPITDSDGDGVPDYRDNRDSDGDGVVDSLDLDSDNDGISDSIEGGASIDSDSDGIADYLDLDSDNDSLYDLTESGISNPASLDTDNDGRIDSSNTVGTNGLANIVETSVDSGSINYTVANTDTDGITNYRDLDSDNDGIPDSIEGAASIDSDSDGIADYLDLDSDNDGLYDLAESGISNPTSLDTDNDGRIDSSNTVGTNGLANIVETSVGSGNINYTVADTDTDGIADFRDLDSDSDGLFDIIEAGGNDPDNDGILGSGTPSVDGNGLATGAGLALIDTDNDDIPNQRDLDADNDGTPDANDAFPIDNSEIADRDGDGIGNNADLDADNDGIPDSVEGDASIDSDADGTPDYLDRDSDGDGIDDIIEAGGSDTDNDGQVDGFTDTNNDGLDDTLAITPLPITDSNGDGTPDYRDSADNDADGVVNSLDLDADNDGIPDSAEGNANIDTDGDGIADHLDLDSDNDGIPDLIESGINDPAALDTDNDGRIDASNPVGNNGLADAVETATDSGRADYNGDGTADAPRDSDNDNLPDYRDLDSDNDGINDIIEAGGTDANEDGRLDGPMDANNDGFDDSLVNNPLPDIHTDADSDGIPDYRDNDDLDSDGIADILDLDNDNDGIPNLIEGSAANVDTDSDGIPDYRDLDSDNDGLFDLTESGISNPATLDSDNNGRIDNSNAVGSNGLANAVETSADIGDINYIVADTDNDGIDDYRDLDTDNDGIPDVTEAGGNDPDGDGVFGNGTPIVDNNGLVTGAGLNPGNFDNDDAPDYRDSDSDGDGVNDIIEAGGDDIDSDGQVDDFTDTNNDGLDDTLAASPLPLPDSDGNGVPDYQDNADLDNDGISNTSDLDNDNDGIPDLIEGSNTDVDTDSDGIPDYRDLDSDNDGLFDLTESGIDTHSVLDTDSNGRIDISNTVGSNGLADTVETNTDSGTINYILTDSDDDGIDDYRDLDSDGDGIPDVIESNHGDADNDGRIGSGNPSVDSNGTASGSGATALDSDNDGIPDYRDLDSDNDSITDVVEAGGTDNDGDGRQDATGDIDGNGFDDAVQATPLPRVDTDGDGIPDYRDPATAARQPRTVRTGLDGLGGCTLNPGATVDPMLPLLLLIALLSLWRRKRCTKQQTPNQ